MYFLLANLKAKVLFDYSAQAANQINLKVGQTINVVTFGGAGGWSSGQEMFTGLSILLILKSIRIVHFVKQFRETRILPQ